LPVGESLEKTLELLATTKNEAAVAVLVPALDSQIDAIRLGALRSLLERRSHVGQREVLARLHTFTRKEREVVSAKLGQLSQALRAAVLGSDEQMMANGFQAMLWLREYELVPPLVRAVEDTGNPRRDDAARTLLELAKLLYTELAGQRDARSRRDPQMVRRFVVGSLERSASRYAQHKSKPLIEAFLILANRENATLKRILNDPHHPAFLTVVETLTQGEHGGLIRLLLAFLDDPFAPMAALHVVAARYDKSFLRHLTAEIDGTPSSNVARNLKRIDSIVWASGEHRSALDDLDDDGQCAALAIALASGMKRLEVFRTVNYLLSYGKPAARRAAARALHEFQGADANRLALDALNDRDPAVQAEIVKQLRHRGMPGALQHQIERLDSRHEIVRQAARESLSEFSFARYLAAFETLDDEARRRTGQLVRKVDPQAAEMLLDELKSGLRAKRMRALQVAESLDLLEEIEGGLIDALADEDHLVRVEAVRLLVQAATPNASRALRQALLDKSAVVQQAAERGLLELEQRANRKNKGATNAPDQSVRDTQPMPPLPSVNTTTPEAPNP